MPRCKPKTSRRHTSRQPVSGSIYAPPSSLTSPSHFMAPLFDTSKPFYDFPNRHHHTRLGSSIMAKSNRAPAPNPHPYLFEQSHTPTGLPVFLTSSNRRRPRRKSLHPRERLVHSQTMRIDTTYPLCRRGRTCSRTPGTAPGPVPVLRRGRAALLWPRRRQLRRWCRRR